MKTLKQETIRGLSTKGSFKMSTFGWIRRLLKLKSIPGTRDRKLKDPYSCGTACCGAGHIVAAATRLDRKLNMREIDAEYTRRQLCPPKQLIYADDTDPYNKYVDNESEVARAARVHWARSYGNQEARRLGFTSAEWGEDLDGVTPEMYIAHLEGSKPKVP
jgi:hypothetical protein